jgi:hypothetical protein
MSAFASRASVAWSMVPRARPSASVKQASTASCVVKALVEATPISGPAKVISAASASRAMVLSGWLTSARVVAPCFFKKRIASSVSRVSPDCEMKSETPLRFKSGAR